MATFPNETSPGIAGEINYIDLTPDYVTGLSEGTSSFTYTKYLTNIAPRFTLKLTSSDKNLVYSILRFFNAGNVYRAGKTGLAFVASSSEDLARIVEHFDSYPLKGHKADCYKLWRQLVEMKRAFRRSDFSELSTIASALSKTTAKGRHHKIVTTPQEKQ